LSLLDGWAVDLLRYRCLRVLSGGARTVQVRVLLSLHVVFIPQPTSRNCSVQSPWNLDQSYPEVGLTYHEMRTTLFIVSGVVSKDSYALTGSGRCVQHRPQPYRQRRHAEGCIRIGHPGPKAFSVFVEFCNEEGHEFLSWPCGVLEMFSNALQGWEPATISRETYTGVVSQIRTYLITDFAIVLYWHVGWEGAVEGVFRNPKVLSVR